MIRFSVLLLILHLIISSKTLAQDSNIKGKTIDDITSQPASNVNIHVYTGDKIIYHTTSDSSGIFNIPLHIYNQLNYIKIKSLSYEELVIRKNKGITIDKNNSIGTFRIKPSSISLKEVVINRRTRYRDTTKIDLSKQTFERSIMIDDLFSNYGFSKDNNGKLYYKDKPVSNLTVNGAEFFGKNNMDIFQLLPALTLENMEIVETDIDSITNTTMLRPQIKMNLKLKEKYNNGKFGNLSLGIGTLERYIAAADLYTYRKKEQISVSFNTNNINIRGITPGAPPITFSANGNNTLTNDLRLTYKNSLSKRIELELSVKGKNGSRNYESLSERKDELLDQLSTTTTKSKMTLLGITDARMNLNYKIDSLNTISFTNSMNYDRTKLDDSLNYLTRFNSLSTISNLSKIQKTTNHTDLNELNYRRLFSSKTGRSLMMRIERENATITNNESNNIYKSSDQITKSYFIDMKKESEDKSFTFNSNFTEPLGESSYLDFSVSYKYKSLNYKTDLNSDSLINTSTAPIGIFNQYLQSGIKFQKTTGKFSIESSINGLYNRRDSKANEENNEMSFTNFDLNLNIDYRINSKKGLILNFKKLTNYPKTNELININNSFDLIHQMSNNIYLKSEVKNSIKIDYNLKSSNQSTLTLSAGFDYYTSKFGYNSNAQPNTIQYNYIDNIGNAFASELSVMGSVNLFKNLNINYKSTATYLEQPTIINNKLNPNKGIILSQSLSTTKKIFKEIWSISPRLNAYFSKYFFESSNSKILNITYSDQLSFSIKKISLNIEPIINHNRNINTLTSASVNCTIKKNVLRNNGIIWIQGHDIFNSFKYTNNYLGSNFTQTTTYSNTTRYFIIGINLKFNNMK